MVVTPSAGKHGTPPGESFTQRGTREQQETDHGNPPPPDTQGMTSNLLDVQAIRSHFDFLGRGRLVTNNAASTQPRRELLPLYRSLGPRYENVHRGQSTASREMTALFEDAYDTIAAFIGTPGGRAPARPISHPKSRKVT